MFYLFLTALLFPLLSAHAQTNTFAPLPGQIPDTGATLLRMIGALLLVLALFFAGIWAVRNWQRWAPGPAAKLKIIESRSLGQRHTLHVVSFEQQRWLIAASPTQVNLLGELALAEEGAVELAPAAPPKTIFSEALRQVLGRKA